MPDDFFEPISNKSTPPKYLYFNGQEWAASSSGTTTQVYSPVDGEVMGELQVVSEAEIDMVVQRVSTAQIKWAEIPLYKRVGVVHLAADWVRHYEEYLAALLVREIGKTHDDAKSEILRTADLMDYYADEAQSIRGETLDSDNFPGFDKGRVAVIERVPYGVVAAIAPFNYPVNLSASKIAPALLMGNGVVFKPPTQGGISALHLARIFEKAGLPKGVFAAVTGGGGVIGDALVKHPGVAMVAFTGSSETGLGIGIKTGMKPLLFECGGNNPAIIFPDAEAGLTARELVKGAFSYCGQRCTAIKYVLGHQGVLDELIPVVEKTMDELVKVGDPRSPETKMVGPVISEEAAQKVESAIEEAVGAGAQIIRGGTREHLYIQPTLLKNVRPEMKIVAEEIFGPVLSFIAVENMDEVVKIINSSRFGLQACIFTADEGAGLKFANQLDVGTVQINGSPQRGPDHFPFLGVRESGVGVQGVRYALEAMSRLKPVVINKPS